MRIARKPKTKTVACTHCGEPNDVAARAMSIFCAHCRKRLIIENYVIKGYEAVKDYATCGDIVVNRNGRIAAPVQVANLTVKGTVRATVDARGRVEVTRTGELIGDVTATALHVHKGAQLVGFCRIKPLRAPATTPPSKETHP